MAIHVNCRERLRLTIPRDIVNMSVSSNLARIRDNQPKQPVFDYWIRILTAIKDDEVK